MGLQPVVSAAMDLVRVRKGHAFSSAMHGGCELKLALLPVFGGRATNKDAHDGLLLANRQCDLVPAEGQRKRCAWRKNPYTPSQSM